MWFNEKRGFGMIEISSCISGQRKSAFVHYKNIQTNGFKTLKVGQRVCFDLYVSPNGLEAKTVHIDP
jgi:CspA family cold shock protein